MAQEPQHPAQSPGVAPAPRDKAADDKAAKELREQMQAASIGAQVILDFNEDGSVGARGGAAGTIEENTAIRDACLLGLGLDPVACSGPPSEERAKKLKEPPKAEPAAKPVPKATRASSLAVGA